MSRPPQPRHEDEAPVVVVTDLHTGLVVGADFEPEMPRRPRRRVPAAVAALAALNLVVLLGAGSVVATGAAAVTAAHAPIPSDDGNGVLDSQGREWILNGSATPSASPAPTAGPDDTVVDSSLELLLPPTLTGPTGAVLARGVVISVPDLPIAATSAIQVDYRGTDGTGPRVLLVRTAGTAADAFGAILVPLGLQVQDETGAKPQPITGSTELTEACDGFAGESQDGLTAVVAGAGITRVQVIALLTQLETQVAERDLKPQSRS